MNNIIICILCITDPRYTASFLGFPVTLFCSGPGNDP